MKDGMEGMHDLDDELRSALRREEPPTGFAERVLDRVAEQAQNAQMWGPPSASAKASADRRSLGEGWSGGPIRLKPDPTVGFIHWAAAAALVAAMAGGFEYVAKQAQRAEGEAARERVVLALHIAGNKLQLVQTKINRLHEQPEKNSNQ